jgi:F-type H+-transporting ATPase subunit b
MAEKDIEREQKKAVNALKDDISTMAMLVASKVLEKDMSVEDHKGIIDDVIEKAGDRQWQN